MADQVVPDYDQDRLDYEMVSPAQILPDGDSGHADVSLPHAAGHVGHTIHEPEVADGCGDVSSPADVVEGGSLEGGDGHVEHVVHEQEVADACGDGNSPATVVEGESVEPGGDRHVGHVVHEQEVKCSEVLERQAAAEDSAVTEEESVLGDDESFEGVSMPAAGHEELEMEEGPTDTQATGLPVVNETGLKFEDSQKIKVPDPELVEEQIIKESEPEPSEEEEKTNLIEGAWADILGSGQLKKKVLKAGKPNSRPANSDLCTIGISGTLSNGKLVEVNENLTFRLGDLEVIQGLDLAVALMDTGETCQLEIAPRFAYGSLGHGKDIPPDATILYTVELKEAGKDKDLEQVTLNERLRIGNAKRERGNWWYSRGDYTSSIQCYRRALDYLDTENETETDSPEKLQEVLDDRLKVYNNMGAAQMKIEAYDAALKSVEHVLRCQTDNVKALYRKSKIMAATGKVAESVSILERALHLDPSSKIIQQDLARLQSKQKLEAQKEKSLYKKMFGIKTVATQATQAAKGKTKVKLAVPWTLMIGAVTAVVASYVTYRYKLF